MITRLQRLAYRAAFQVMRVWWFVVRPHTHGVKLVVWAGDEVLFVRHTYGNRRTWELPGGGRHRGESPEAAATREAREELGLVLERWAGIGVIEDRQHATAHLTCLATRYDGTPLRLSRAELSEAAWHQPSDPPQPLGRHAAQAMALPGFAASAR
ncbi:NUDIX hydrolase [Paraconexibacter antarcticus]|uniref:NUDIX hydrolase n=1 Tax=Paraconexibacter antarcticus TaxID=2949664 RepID=UPI0026652D5F|nr:NUDIX hydrolase [Paraconexibacter antarcticus]